MQNNHFGFLNGVAIVVVVDMALVVVETDTPGLLLVLQWLSLLL